jgi:NAD(P)-dependent dehydrogenase (short-subunit alcohol dehydrogenase family)
MARRRGHGVVAGKTAVVTGAFSEIGRAVALRLGEAGAHVFAAGHRAEALASTVGAIAGPAVQPPRWRPTCGIPGAPDSPPTLYRAP